MAEGRVTRFLVIEGNSGVGKSTIAESVAARLGAALFHYPPEFMDFRVAADIDRRLSPRVRLAYYLAATAHLGELVTAALARRSTVCDRYVSAVVSLFEAERSLPSVDIQQHVEPLLRWLPRPDLILLVRARQDVARDRMERRLRLKARPSPTRVEELTVGSDGFFWRREEALRRFGQSLAPLVELDTSDLTVDEMLDAGWGLVSAPLLDARS